MPISKRGKVVDKAYMILVQNKVSMPVRCKALTVIGYQVKILKLAMKCLCNVK